MTKLRKGDVVHFKATVVDVADYSDAGQQIRAKLLPKGEEIGWCVPSEYDFKPAELVLKVGDRVRHVERGGEAEIYEVMGLFANNQAAIRKLGNWPVEVVMFHHVRRL